MTNGYILEIRTSSSSPGAEEMGAVGVGPQKSMNRTDRLKAQFKGIDSKDNDLTLRMNKGSSTGTDAVAGAGSGSEGRYRKKHGGSKHSRKSSSHSLDKYIKFTVKRSDHSEDDLFNRMTKFMFIFLSVGLFWHVLNNVDPIGKVIGGGERLREMNDVVLREYYKLTEVFNRRRYRVDEGLAERSEHADVSYDVNSESRIREGVREVVLKAVLIAEKIFYEMKMDREECFVQDLISLFYLGISVFVINEIYWRIYHEIEESLIIIPHLGVQVESILIKENIWQVLRSVIGLRRLLQGVNMSLGVAQVPAQQVPPYNGKEKGIVINKQFVPMDYVKDIVINEGFKGFEVVFYMTLIMEEGVVVLNSGGSGSGGSGEPDGEDGAVAARPAYRDAAAFDSSRESTAGDADDDGGSVSGSGDGGNGHAGHDGSGSGDTTGDAEQTKLKMIVVFPNLLPRRAVLETVFRKSREYLKR